jgi:hypothetical protein
MDRSASEKRALPRQGDFTQAKANGHSDNARGPAHNPLRWFTEIRETVSSRAECNGVESRVRETAPGRRWAAQTSAVR